MRNEDRIREIIIEWADATKNGRKDDVLKNHAIDAIVYDPLPPLRYLSAADYRESFDVWWPETSGEGLFELQDLQVVCGDDVAFAYGLLRCGGAGVDGEDYEDLVRVTICFQKMDGHWLIQHQHTSMPMKVGENT